MQVSKLVGLGRIKPVISDIYPLSELNEAIERLRSGKILARAAIKP
ncbi:MAG: zinc-binding dehydrogenase [Candidatus Humimicrobiaceae bacterium]